MSNQIQRRKYEHFSILTPWETEPEETSINKYCSDFIQQYQLPKNTTTLPKIHKRRAISTCTTIKKSQHFFPPQKTSVLKHFPDSLAESSQKQLTTISQDKTERVDKKKCQRGNPLQELSVKNFIIEGGQQQSSLYKQKVLKKRESSYILKQKFAQFRRSIKLGSQNKQNSNFRVIRYEN